MQWRGVRRLSVHPSVNFCANRFSQANGRIATKLAQDGLQVSVDPGCAQGQGQRSRDTGTFVLARKSLLLPGKWPDRDQTCTWWSPGKLASRVCSRSRSRSKVTWYGHFCAGTKIAFSSRQKWPDRDQTCTWWSPGQPASRVCSSSRSKVTWYAHFLGFLEWATLSLTVWFSCALQAT